MDKPQITVGRDPACDIPIDNLGVSRRHCTFAMRGDLFVVQDLGSSNGTYVNGRKVAEYFLNDADEIVIGKYTLRFRNEAQKPAAAQSDSAVPDTGNTYVVDSPKLLEKLNRAREGAAKLEGAGATAKDYARALDPGGGPEQAAGDVARLRNYLVALCVVVVGLLVLVGVLLVLLVNKT